MSYGYRFGYKLGSVRASGGGGAPARTVFVGIGDSLVPGRDNLNSARNPVNDPLPTNAAQFSNNSLAPLPFQEISTSAGPIYFPESGSEVGRISPLERLMIDYQAAAGGTVGVIPLAVGGSSLQVGWNATNGDILATRTAEHNLAMSRFEAFDGITPVVGAVVIDVSSNDNAAIATIRGWLEGLIAHVRANFTGVTATTPIILGGPVKGADNSTNVFGWGYRRLFAEIASEQNNVFLMHPPYPTANADNLHPTLLEARTWGANLAVKARQALAGTEPLPTWLIPASPPVNVGTQISIDLTHSGLSLASPYGVPVITGGANAALFELAGDFFAPTLRWLGNGTGPAIGSYEVIVSLRNNAGQVGNPLTLTVRVLAEVSPAEFFEAGDRGYVVDLDDLSTLWQDREGTIPVTAVGQPVGRILDKSPNAWLLQADANNSTRPTYQVDAEGNGMLEFAGGQYLRSSNPVLANGIAGNAAQWTCAAAVEMAAQSAQRNILSDNANDTVSFVDFLQIEAGDDFRASGRFNNLGFPAPTTLNVLTGTTTPFIFASQYEGTLNNGAVFRPLRSRVASATAAWTELNNGPNTNTNTCNKFVIGARFIASASNQMTGRLGSFYIINKVLSATNRQASERFVAARSVENLA